MNDYLLVCGGIILIGGAIFIAVLFAAWSPPESWKHLFYVSGYTQPLPQEPSAKRAGWLYLDELMAVDGLSNESWFMGISPNAASADWQSCTLDIQPDYVAVYYREKLIGGQSAFTFNGDNVRWFSHPVFGRRSPIIWLDIDHDGLWTLIGLQLPRPEMNDFTAVLKRWFPSDLPRERKKLPNIRRNPVKAFRAREMADGNWEMLDAIQLYLTPLYLVELRDEVAVRQYPLDSLSQLDIRWVDEWKDERLLRFRVAGELHGYAITHWHSFYPHLEKLIGNKKPPKQPRRE